MKKYIAVFDIPDDYGVAYAVAKIAPKGNDIYTDSDFTDAYAPHIELLSKEQSEVFEQFNEIEGIVRDLGICCAYDMPGFWCNSGNDYKVIPTKYHKGYMKALEDVERNIRSRFGLAEREEIVMPPFA